MDATEVSGLLRSLSLAATEEPVKTVAIGALKPSTDKCERSLLRFFLFHAVISMYRIVSRQ